MANPVLPIPQYPDVPVAPGVPPVLRDSANSGPDTGAPLSGDAADVTDTSNVPQWGLFDSGGNPVITADSVFGFEFKKSWNLPTYPQEPGGTTTPASFQSYNKVELPGEPRIVFTQGGSIADRTAFLDQVASVCASLDLYSAYTPEFVWPSINAIDYNILRRTSEQGATLLKVEVILREVRVDATQQFSSSSTQTLASPTNTATPSGQAQRTTGAVQPQGPTPSQELSVQSALAQQTLLTF
jgi:hypothetical protein